MLFLRYKKISKKAFKLGSFLQCSVQIFLGHGGWIWKVNLILWKNVIKNLQVKHRQYDSIIFSSEGFTQLLGLCLADSRILYCWNVLESLRKFIIELHVLQCLFVRGFDKRQKSGRIASNFTKRENFASFMTIKCSRGLFYNVASLLALFRLAKKTLNCKQNLLIYFENSQDVPYSHDTSRNSMMNTSIIVNIIPTCKR